MADTRREMHEAAAEQAASKLVLAMRHDQTTLLRGEAKGAGGGGAGGVGAGDVARMDSCVGGFRAANVGEVRALLDVLRRLVFPGFFDAEPLRDGDIEPHVTQLCVKVAGGVRELVRGVLRYGRRPAQHGFERHVQMEMTDDAFVERVVSVFMQELVNVRRLLALDVQAAFDGDPAAEHTDEIILCYPGLDAIFTHRVSHVLYSLGVPVLPRVMSEQAHSRTAIDIHPGAVIGESFFIDHGSATVIGETSHIGAQVKIYQGVTLGARSFPKDERGRAIKGLQRHPTIGDRVTIYAGAVILGGDTVVGNDAVIAGGVFVASSVPEGHVVQQPRAELVMKRAGGKGGAASIGWLGDGEGI